MKSSVEIYTKRLTFEIGEGTMRIPRWVYVTLVKSETTCLIDTGTAGNFREITEFCSEHGVEVNDIDLIINTHCHPDHIGGNLLFKQANPDISFSAHPLAKLEIEDLDRQYKRRPLPGFHRLIAGPVTVDRPLDEGDLLDIGGEIHVLHTPGHSRGSISLLLPDRDTLIVGDAIPGRTDVPIYENVEELRTSIDRLGKTGVSHVISAFDGECGSVSEAARLGNEIIDRVDTHVGDYLARYASEHPGAGEPEATDVCRYVLDQLGFTSVAPIPIITNSIKAHLQLR